MPRRTNVADPRQCLASCCGERIGSRGFEGLAYAAYQNILKPALAVPVGWTGSTTGCVAGSPSAAAQDATLTAVNFYRNMAGLTPVTLDPVLSADAQQAALMMLAQQALSHAPGSLLGLLLSRRLVRVEGDVLSRHGEASTSCCTHG